MSLHPLRGGGSLCSPNPTASGSPPFPITLLQQPPQATLGHCLAAASRPARPTCQALAQSRPAVSLLRPLAILLPTHPELPRRSLGALHAPEGPTVPETCLASLYPGPSVWGHTGTGNTHPLSALFPQQPQVEHTFPPGPPNSDLPWGGWPLAVFLGPYN